MAFVEGSTPQYHLNQGRFVCFTFLGGTVKRGPQADELLAYPDRKLRVIGRVAFGQSSPDIGKKLHISASAVDTDVLNARKELGAERSNLFVAAVRLEALTIDDDGYGPSDSFPARAKDDLKVRDLKYVIFSDTRLER